jgi:M6 family metalloprotease-like protein
VYAELEGGVLKATAMTAHDEGERSAEEVAFLENMPVRQMPAMTPQILSMKQQAAQATVEHVARRRAGGTNFANFKGLIILAEYKDQKFSRKDYKQLMDDMANREGYTGFDDVECTGSVRDYFIDNSNGLFKPEFTVVGPYTLDYSQYYAEGTKYGSTLVRAAVDAADADVDYKDFDGDGDGYVDLVLVIFAGNGANFTGNDERLIWPHRYNFFRNKKDDVYVSDYACTVELYGYTSRPETIQIAGIGTICHEFSHVLGLPDFYDVDYEVSGQSNHLDNWSVMAQGCYANYDKTPVGYSLYERYSVGFMNEPPVISSPGSMTLDPLPLLTSRSGYRINTPVNNEFFLLENRQQTAFKWDTFLPGSGMLVHRVDKTNSSVWSNNTVNVNPDHNYYELVRAGGIHSYTYNEKVHFESTAADVFPGDDHVTELGNATSPANLLSWSGKPCTYELSNIQMTDEGLITFDVTSTDIPEGIVELRTKTVPSEAPLYNLHGQRVTRQHRGLLIQGEKKVLNK